MTYPALHELMRSYLHQDYDLFGSFDDNLRLYAIEHPDLAPLLPAEVRQLLATTGDDADLKETVMQMGCQLRPTEGTYRAWLQQIADRVRAATG